CARSSARPACPCSSFGPTLSAAIFSNQCGARSTEFFNKAKRMNDSSPPRIPTQPVIVAAAVPLGEQPEDRLPIYGVTAAMEAILRQPRRVMFQLRQTASGRLIWAMLLLAIVCSLIYGVVVGTFSGAQQLWAAPAKIALG